MKKFTITYDPYHKDSAVPDALTEATANQIAMQIQVYTHAPDCNPSTAITCSEIVLMYVRALVKEKKLDHNCVIVRYKDNIIPITDDGRFQYWPDGFCNYADVALNRIIGI